MPLPSRIEAEHRYERLRKQALEIAQSAVGNKFKMTQVTQQALESTERWIESGQRQYHWDWKSHYPYYRSMYPKRFEVALWEQDQLSAIALGRPTYNATGLRLDIVEAMPRDLGARSNVFDPIILAYEVYARMINANHIRIMNPVNDAVRSFYEKYGYEYVPKGNYLKKDII